MFFIVSKNGNGKTQTSNCNQVPYKRRDWCQNHPQTISLGFIDDDQGCPERKLCRQQICEKNLPSLERIPKLLELIITRNETWVHHQDPENKLGPMRWVHKNLLLLKKGHTESSAGKLMAIIFWNMEGTLLIE